MQVAVQRPRDEQLILKRSLEELEIYPSMAQEAIYARPVGKETGSSNQKIVEGLSIRAAESLANRWANSAYGAEIVSDDGTLVTIAAVFMDYEHNTRHVVQRRVNRFYKAAKGGVREFSPDRFETIVSANISKCLREVILRSLPAGLKKEYEQKAKATNASKDIRKRRSLMVKAFAELGITKAQIEEKFGLVSKMKHADLDTITGIYNAVRNGEVPKEEVFTVKSEAKRAEPAQPNLTPKGSE